MSFAGYQQGDHVKLLLGLSLEASQTALLLAS